MNGYYKQLTQFLKEAGFYFDCQGKGSHEIWTNGKTTVSVPCNCKSRHTANGILRDAGTSARIR